MGPIGGMLPEWLKQRREKNSAPAQPAPEAQPPQTQRRPRRGRGRARYMGGGYASNMLAGTER
jgi:hypothetical protein